MYIINLTCVEAKTIQKPNTITIPLRFYIIIIILTTTSNGAKNYKKIKSYVSHKFLLVAYVELLKK